MVAPGLVLICRICREGHAATGRTRHVSGLDLGTSGVKALLIDARPEDRRRRPRRARRIPAASRLVGAGPGRLDSRHRRGDRRAEGGAPKELAAVKGIGLSGQMHGATLLDAGDKVLRPCILWNDTRSHAEAAKLDADPRFRAVTGNIVFPGFTAPKLAWVKNNEPDIFARVRQGASAEGFSAALAVRRAYLGNVGFGRHGMARCRRAALVVRIAGRDRVDENRCRRWSKAPTAGGCAANSPRDGAWHRHI